MTLLFLSALPREEFVECTSSRGLQANCPSRSLGWVQHFQAQELSSRDLKAGVVGCKVLYIKEFIFFLGMNQESLCSYFQLQHPVSAIGIWEPGHLKPGPHGSQAVIFIAMSPFSSKRHHSVRCKGFHVCKGFQLPL